MRRDGFDTCYLSAPYGMDLGPLQETLDELGVEWRWADTARRLAPHSALQSADCFIGVVTRSSHTQRTLYEAGIAVGLGKPVLLLVAGKQVIPIDDGLVTVARLNIRNRRALKFHIDIFASSPHRDLSSEQALAEPSRPSPPRFDKSSSRSDDGDLPNSPSERELEEYIANLVYRAGGSVTRSRPEDHEEKTYIPDLLISLPEQDNRLLNPAAVELKRSINNANIGQVEDQVLNYIQRTRLPMALIISEKPLPRRQWKKSNRVIWLHLKDFSELTLNGELGDFIRDRRNRDAHGAA